MLYYVQQRWMIAATTLDLMIVMVWLASHDASLLLISEMLCWVLLQSTANSPTKREHQHAGHTTGSPTDAYHMKSHDRTTLESVARTLQAPRKSSDRHSPYCSTPCEAWRGHEACGGRGSNEDPCQSTRYGARQSCRHVCGLPSVNLRG